MKTNNYKKEFNSLNKEYSLLKEKERTIQFEELKVISQLHICFNNWLNKKINY